MQISQKAQLKKRAPSDENLGYQSQLMLLCLASLRDAIQVHLHTSWV